MVYYVDLSSVLNIFGIITPVAIIFKFFKFLLYYLDQISINTVNHSCKILLLMWYIKELAIKI